MSNSDLKLSLHKVIDNISDNSILQAVYILLTNAKNAKGDWYDELSLAEKNSINKGISDAESKNYVSEEEVQIEVDRLLNL